jgi:PAS domain S-box-containing protein
MFFFALLLVVFSGCKKSSREQPIIKTLSFRDIHGITKSEISAIEALQKKYDSFTCGVNISTDSFYDKNGELSGFAILFYDWLSGFFGIPFKPVLYEWGSSQRRIESGEIDFTIELSDTPERRAAFFMTSPIAQRPLKVYQIEGAEPIRSIISSRRLPRIAFVRGTAAAAVKAAAEHDFETIFVDNHTHAYSLLENGEIDAYIAPDTTEAALDVYGGANSWDFFPLVFISSCLLTGNAELEPVISVLEKALDNHTLTYLAGLRKAGYEKYLGNKLYTQLTEEERTYIKDHPLIPVAAEFDNYPISFFDSHTNQWQGIYFDALNEISNLTGLRFEYVNSNNTRLPELVAMLESGKALILSELFRLKDYEGRFLWSDFSFVNDNYTFITSDNFPNLRIDDISHLRVAIRKNTQYSELFKIMFPEHRNFTEYDTQDETWDALKYGEVDAIFASKRRLLINSNYYEEAGFKLNLIFTDYSFDSLPGYNKDAALLKSINSKALKFIKVNNISTQWMNRTYDYRTKLVTAQRPWFIGVSVLIFLMFLVMLISWRKSRSIGKQLEKQVKEQTSDLMFQKSKLQMIIDSIPDLMFCKDMDFRYTQCNKPYERFMGIKEADVIGKSNKDGTWFHLEDTQRIYGVEHTVISEDRVITFEENIHSPYTGKQCYFETVKAPLKQNGIIVGLIAIIRDITQRKEMERELTFQTSKLLTVINSIPDLIVCKDREYKYTQCNKAYEQFIGIKENDILGKDEMERTWFSPEEAEMIFGTERIVMDEDRIITAEERIISPTGREGIFESVKAPIKQDGAVVGLISIIRDITQRKEMERELSYQTTMLKTVIASLPDAVFSKNIIYKYTLCNKYMADLFYKEIEDIIGNDDATALGLSGDTAAMSRETDQRVIDEQRRLLYEEWIKCADGSSRLFETVKSPLIMDGEVIGVMGIGRDITQRKAMEEELEFKTSKLQMIIDSIPDILFCKDTDFKYTQCNRSFEDFWGVNETAMLGLTDENGAWFPPDLIKKMHNTELIVMGNDKVFTREIDLVAPLTGKEAVFESVLSPLKQNGAIVGMMGIARNITQRKAMEEEIRAASSAKTAFLANMSHELRTPLNVVIGLTDLLLEDNHLTDHVSTNLLKISNAGSTLLSIVNDILDFSKIESGKLVLTPVEYYTSSLLNDVITLVVTRLGEKPITFNLDISDELPSNLYGDDLRVKQIFTNLLTNAIKYTREGDIWLSVQCIRESNAIWMEVTVTDTGIGIREENLKKLFSDYYQADTKANRNIEGTGLGLSITKRLVDMMDGEIHAESEYGKGTTFRIRIRQGFVSNTVIGSAVANSLRNFHYTDSKRIVTRKLVRLNLSYAKVLVVDDMHTNLDVASGLLSNYKMQVDCLDNGQAAINRIREGNPVYNAIFMDHMMPGMDGVEAADAIRALGTEYARNIPIIALTANAIQGTEEMFYEHGFQAFISKPIDVVELDSVIKKWVRDDDHEDIKIFEAPPAADAPSKIDIPGVDTEKGLSLYIGDTKVYLPLLRSYVSNTPGVLDKMRNVSAETLSDYVITVHGLKGTSAGIGAETIREAAMNLEIMSRVGDLDGVLAQNDKLIKDAEIIVGNVNEWLKQYDAAHDAKPRLKAPDRKLLTQLRQCCENYDIEGIDKAMSELESADYEEDADLVVWIKQKIDISKIGEVAERLAGKELSLQAVNNGGIK